MTSGVDSIMHQKILDDHRRQMMLLDQQVGQQKDRQLNDVQVRAFKVKLIQLTLKMIFKQMPWLVAIRFKRLLQRKFTLTIILIPGAMNNICHISSVT